MGVVSEWVQASRTGVLALGFVTAVSITGVSADAGVLNGHASAYNDGNGPSAGAWTGTTAFDNGQGVSGTIDWAVFGPGNFPFSNYTPTGGELTYAYQIFASGTSSIHSLTLNDPNSAMNNIGDFNDLAGEAPIAAAITTLAEWNFAGLDASENSTGLAYSSSKRPTDLFGAVVNGGSFAIAIPLPVPGSVDIPEPASLALIGTGALAMLRRRR